MTSLRSARRKPQDCGLQKIRRWLPAINLPQEPASSASPVDGRRQRIVRQAHRRHAGLDGRQSLIKRLRGPTSGEASTAAPRPSCNARRAWADRSGRMRMAYDLELRVLVRRRVKDRPWGDISGGAVVRRTSPSSGRSRASLLALSALAFLGGGSWPSSPRCASGSAILAHRTPRSPGPGGARVVRPLPATIVVLVVVPTGAVDIGRCSQ